MRTKRTNRAARLERNQAVSNGLRALPPKTLIPINGKLVTTSEVATVFELGTEAEKEVSAARAKLTEAIATARAAEAKIRTSIEPIRSFVQHSFGDRSPVAASFGFEPRRTPYVSAEVRYEAIEKLRATRAMRAATRLAGQAN